jgi:hypothetical protein
MVFHHEILALLLATISATPTSAKTIRNKSGFYLGGCNLAG